MIYDVVDPFLYLALFEYSLPAFSFDSAAQAHDNARSAAFVDSVRSGETKQKSERFISKRFISKAMVNVIRILYGILQYCKVSDLIVDNIFFG